MRILSMIDYEISEAEKLYEINSKYIKVILFFPIIVVSIFILLMGFPQTRSIANRLIRENNPIELLTFFFLIVGGSYGIFVVLKLKEQKKEKFLIWFYTIFSLGLIFTGMEEIAWGQWFFRFKTPEVLREINMQKEMTLHNIRGLQGHSEYFRLLFGVGGLIGVFVSFL